LFDRIPVLTERGLRIFRQLPCLPAAVVGVEDEPARVDTAHQDDPQRRRGGAVCGRERGPRGVDAFRARTRGGTQILLDGIGCEHRPNLHTFRTGTEGAIPRWLSEGGGMVRALVRLILLIVIVVAAAAFFLGYWGGGAGRPADHQIGTAGHV